MKVVIKPSNSYDLEVDGVPIGTFKKTGDLEGVTAFKSDRGVLLALDDKPEKNVFMEIFGGEKRVLGCELTLDVLSVSAPIGCLIEVSKTAAGN